MMQAAGLGIAYHAKPKVVQQAQASVCYAGLGGVLCILSGILVKQQKVSWQVKP
jgi:phosphoserine phosphatase